MLHNCMENCCRHVQAFAIIGRQPFDCRGYLEQTEKEAIFGATGGKRRQFALESIKTPINFQLVDTEAHQLFVDR